MWCSVPAPGTRATAWPSPWGAATTSRSPRYGPWPAWWSGCRSRRSWPTSARFSRRLTGDSQLRWLGPEKGAIHMAAGGDRQRGLGPVRRRAGRQAAVAAAADLSPEQLVDLVDFRYLQRRAHRGRGAGDPAPRRSPAAPSASRTCCERRLPGLHDDPGLARLRRREAGPAVQGGGRRRLRPDQAEGRRRPRRTTSAGCGWPARRSARTSGSPWTPTRPGGSSRRSTGWARSRPSTRTGSRSPPPPTTSSAMPRSAGRWRRSRWPPASTSTTR